MMAIRLPRLLDRNLKEIARLDPADVSIELNLAPLSTAEMTLVDCENTVQVGQYVELYTEQGSAGIYRITVLDTDFGGRTVATLEHGLTTLSDAIMTGEGKEESTPRALLKKLLDCQATIMWQLGTIEVPDSVTLTWEYDYSNVLESLVNVLNQLPEYALSFDQTTFPWTLNLVKLAGDDACECRLNRNLESVTLSTDYSELCTRLYIPGADAPLDADTIGQWGVVARSMIADEAIGEEALTREGSAYLEAHKNPMVTVEMDAIDLYEATGEPFDRFYLGRICRVCLPGYSTVLRHRVVRLSYPSVYREPGRVKVTLANPASSAVSTLAGLIVDTTVTRKKVVQNTGDLRDQKDLILAAEESIKLYAQRIEALAKEVEINAESILLKAGKDELISLINMSPEEITIQSSKINLVGYVTATELEAEVARFDDMLAGLSTISTLLVNNVQCNSYLAVGGTMSIGGTQVSMQNMPVRTGAGSITVSASTINYQDWAGNKMEARVINSITYNAPTTSELHYVGYSA